MITLGPLNRLSLLVCIVFTFNSFAECINGEPEIGGLNYFVGIEQLERDLGEYKENLFIERHTLFRYLLDTLPQSKEFTKSDDYNALVMMPQEIRADLIVIDIIDQVTSLLESRRFRKYKDELEVILNDDPIGNFSDWYQKILEIAQEDSRFKRKLNKNLVFQVYDKKGMAIVTIPKLLDKNFSAHIVRNNLIGKYNIYGADPESVNLLASFSPLEVEPFITDKLTVEKMKNIKNRYLKNKKRTYYEEFCKDYLEMENMITDYYKVRCKPNKKNPVSLRVSRNAPAEVRQTVKPLFESINSSRDKTEYTSILAELSGDSNDIQFQSPESILENLETYNDELKEYTYQNLLNAEDDKTVLKLRRWIKNNLEEIQQKINEYNSTNDDNLSFLVKRKIRVRRHEALEQYDTLLKLFPDAPWVSNQEFTLLNDKGRPILTGKSRLERVAWCTKEIAKKIISPENIISYSVGTGVALVTGGNLMAGAASKTLIRDAISGFKYDKTFKNTFRNTPLNLATSMATASGFTPGRVGYLAFVGSVHGGVRSAFTGQDIKTGMAVGAGYEIVRNTVLPHNIAHPTISLSPGEVIDQDYAIKSVLLESGFNASYHALQGATVSLIEKDETPLHGALKGAGYGLFETAVFVKLFGVQYDMHGLVGSEDKLREAFAAEAEYQKTVNARGIELTDTDTMTDNAYQASLDIGYRVGYGKTGWWVEKILEDDASFSAIGFVTSPVGHVKKLNNGLPTLISHEVGLHQMQYRNLGGANFLIQYSIESAKHGTHGSHANADEARLADPDRDVNSLEQYMTHD